MPTPPTITRHRFDLVRRNLTVLEVAHLTPHMLRITLGGPELEGFQTTAPDDNIKLFLDQPDGSVEKRSYTPRSYDAARGELVLDFVDHPGGPAATWARDAKPGDLLNIGGPRGSKVVEGPLSRLLLIGDETALPAMGRWIEEAPKGTEVIAVITVPGPADEQRFETEADLDLRYIHRPLEAGADHAPVIAALEDVTLTDDTFVWIGSEANVVRAARNHLQERGLQPGWLKASGYWTMGVAEGAVKEADLAAQP